jgi:predicted MPP superfamily phosphohydrolase
MQKEKKRPQKLGLKIFLIAVLAVIGIHAVHALTLDRIVEYVETSYTSKKVPVSLDGYTFALITDTHNATPESLEEISAELNRRDIDALFLGGDHALGDGTWQTMQALAQTEAADGIYGVEGNHDDYKALFSVMEDYGITPLDNTGAQIREGIFVAGVQDMWNRKPNAARAMVGASEDDFVILLCHNADYTMRADVSRADIVLSGHTHGGQITLFGFFAPALAMRMSITDYGRRFMGGWCEDALGTDIFVSNGIGSFRNVPRVFARPQVIVITLHAQ